jgi:hypothetical protein
MGDVVLLRFLSSGLIDVGGDDAKLKKLRASIDGVVGSVSVGAIDFAPPLQQSGDVWYQ